MAVNWFEGGRRIRDLICWAAIAGAGIYVIWGGSDQITFETHAPDEPWALASKPCDHSDHLEYGPSFKFSNGKERSVLLCFRATERGRFRYLETTRPANAPPKINVVIGGPPPPETKWYYEGTEYQTEVVDYFLKGKASFEISPALDKEVVDSLTAIEWKAGQERLGDAVKAVGGSLAGFWLLTAVLGWILRGFAGIPAGADHRPRASE